MDKMTPSGRTPAQAEASRQNGSRSVGPLTPAGKAISSANSTTHGLAARAVLLPSERVEDYEANLQDWFVTLRPGTLAEGHIVGRIADIDWRMGRLSRVEERLVIGALETKVAESRPAKGLCAAEETLRAIQAVAVLAEEVKTPKPAESVAQIAGGLQFTVKALDRVQLPASTVVEFENVVTQISAEPCAVPARAFEALARAARQAEQAILVRIVELQKETENERRRLGDAVLLAGDKEARRLERYRAMLNRAFTAELANLKLLREVVPTSEKHFEAVPVELRLLGRSQ